MLEADSVHTGVPVPLQEWFNNHRVSEEMLGREAAHHQIMFVRDTIVPVFGAGLPYEQRENIATVISTHRSKSIELPVYQLKRPDKDLKVVLRNNFHDWKMSVLSDTPIEADFEGLFHTTPPIDPDYTGNPLSHVYFEGFPTGHVFPYYSETEGKQWSAEIQSDEALWASIFLMMRSLGEIKPFSWSTRKADRIKPGSK